MNLRKLLLILALAFANFAVAQALETASIFKDGVVLQRGMPVPVWGWAKPGEAVSVNFAGQAKSAKADDKGKWMVKLDPLKASSTPGTMEIKGGDKNLTIKNILVGEVWIAAGQSNMNVFGPDRDTGLYPHYISPRTKGGKPEIRIVRYGFGASLEPLSNIEPLGRKSMAWKTLPQNKPVASFDIPIAFARVVRDAVDVPVGVIHVSVSGTNQGAWMSKETLKTFHSKKYPDYYEELFAYHNDNLAKKGKGNVKSWKDYLKAMDAWRKNPKGRSPANMTMMNFPTTLYNTRIHPLAPFAVKGVIWHQGESGPRGPYGERLVAMAKQWRKLFGQDFYFIWGTLTRSTDAQPPLKPLPDYFYRSSTNRSIRQAVPLFGGDKKAAMVELYDVGDQVTHFLQKGEAGRRFGLAALTIAYGKDDVYSGPLSTDIEIDGAKAVVHFDRVADGISYKPSIDGISGVYVKDKKGKFHWGNVRIVDKNSIEITNSDVQKITGIAYAENQNPHETLFNSKGFPASPFAKNLGRIPWSGHAKDMRLVSLKNNAKAKLELNLAHLRAEGYVFQILPGRKTPKNIKVTVSAYIGKDWKDYSVEINGKPVDVKESTTDGMRRVTFPTSDDGAWIVVAEKGKAAKLGKVHRF